LVSCTDINNPPNAFFSVYPTRGDTTTVFLFDASDSSDPDQYTEGLYVRWDWESDGTWDTDFTQIKTINHIFNWSGYVNVCIEVKDNYDESAFYTKEIIIGKNLVSTVTDNRDGRIYKTVKIGDNWWFAENLNFGTMLGYNIMQSNNNFIEKYCYNNDTLDCSNFGGKYFWTEAMQYSFETYTQGICPKGWHIPTRKEWEETFDHYPVDTDFILPGGHFGYDLIPESWQYNVDTLNLFWKWTDTEYWTSSMINTYPISINPILKGILWDIGKSKACYIRCIKDN